MSNARLPVPVRGLLDETLTEATVKKAWGRLDARRAARAKRPAFRSVWRAALVGAAIAVAAALLWLRPVTPSPLALIDGRDVPQSLQAVTAPFSFDDGSRIDMTPETRLDLLESTPRVFSLALRAGQASFEVHPGGPRRWKIECGPVTVEVVGTHFDVTRDEHHVRVSVQHGAVLVSGEPVPDQVVRLGPNQFIDVPLQTVESTMPPADTRERVAVPTLPEAPRRDEPALSPHFVPDPKRDAMPPRSEVPSAALPPAPVSAASAQAASFDVGTALALADRERVAGRFRDAATILERIVAEHRSDPSISLAEFSLGRLYLDSFGDGGRAATHFSRALLRGLPDALAEDAYARLVEAYARSGSAALAKDVAERYRALYPNGRRRDDVTRWASDGR
jgi:transmembrane sensor